MTEAVRELDLGVTWSPNAPKATLRYGDGIGVTLEVAAQEADADQRRVAITWQRCVGLVVGTHNDETQHLHRLYDIGLSEIHWAGEVTDSSWLAATAPLVHDATGLRHYTFPLKECTIELPADGIEVTRSAAV